MNQKQIEWIEKKLGDICEIIGGKPAPKEESAFSRDGIPFVKMQDLGRYHLTLDLIKTRDKINPEYAYKNSFTLIKKGSILIPRSGSVSLNHRAILGEDAYIVSHICALVIKNEQDIYNKFLYYVLRRFDMRSIMNKTTGLDAVNFQSLKRIKLKFPPIDEQKKIVQVLEKTEKQKEKSKKVNELLEEYLKSVFNEMFYNKGFEEIELQEIGTLERGKSKHRPRNDPILLNGKYPLIQTGDIVNSKMFIAKYNQTYSEEGLKQSKLWKKGTLCITIAANIGETGILTFDACFPDSVVGFTPNSKLVLSEYIHFLFSTFQKKLEDSAPQSAQKNINLKILRSLRIPLPPLPLQQKFAAIVEQVEKMKDTVRIMQNKSEELFNSLMQKAFRGEQ